MIIKSIINAFLILGLLFIVLFVLIKGCEVLNFSAGTHGSIKTYQYPISKYILDSVVQKVIANNHRITIDSTRGHYNDEHNYVTMEIRQPGMTYKYTFRYTGDSTYWNTSSNLSELFICYAWDANGNGGSEGNNGVSWYHWRLKRKLTKPFETEFISRLDSILQMRHTNPD